MTQTHLEKCEERRKIKTKITAQERKIYAVFLQVTMHLSCLSDGLVSERISIDLFLVPKLIYSFLGLVQITKQRTSIKNRCFIIMGLTVKINVSLITSSKTCSVNV